ncbi:MAG: DUF503 domain-containing protein [Planctomycetota bacterium]
MIIAALQFELAIHGAESLKDKRRVVKSLKDRLHREHMVSVAETAALNTPTTAVMGLAVVGNDGKRLGSVLDSIVGKLLALHDAELVSTTRELIKGRDPEEVALEDSEPNEGDLTDINAEMMRYAEGDS